MLFRYDRHAERILGCQDVHEGSWCIVIGWGRACNFNEVLRLSGLCFVGSPLQVLPRSTSGCVPRLSLPMLWYSYAVFQDFVINFAGMGTPPMRSPSMYADGTPRTPRQDDEVEEAAPAYVRAMRSRCQSRAGTPTNMDTTDNENSAHNVPEPSNGPTRTSNDPTSEPTEKVSKPTSFAWPPPTDDPDLFRKFRCPPTQPSTSNGHQQDLGHSTQPPVPSTAPATPQDTRQSDNNAGTDLTNRNKSTANVERRSRARSTVRVPTRRSRQDALLEENPSPPPVSRRRTSRSPTPFRRSPSPEPRPRTPGENRRSPAMGSAYEPREDRFAPAASTNRMSRRDTVGDRVPIAPGVQRM
ncbi:unnamed protein product, partial [Haemonchus placei]|uniref:Peptidase S1 domain-containing protein n=1 Tax=Haemonchus placei TaxID=6290 RepID=A0A0N4XBS7_HAEPC